MYTSRAARCRKWICNHPSKFMTNSTHGVNGFNRRISSHSIPELKHPFLKVPSIRKHHGSLLHSYPLCRSSSVRAYSAEGDERNTSEGDHVPVKGSAHFLGGRNEKGKCRVKEMNCSEHFLLGIKDQEEWLSAEKLAIDSRIKESPFLSRTEKLKNELSRRVIPWEKISLTLETFPYYIHEYTKNLLLECSASHLRYKNITTTYGAHLSSSSGRILLQSIPGTELYRERLVRALAGSLKVSLLIFNGSVLSHYDFQDINPSEMEDEEATLLAEETASGSEVDEETDSSHVGKAGADEKSECSNEEEVDFEGSTEALKKLVPYDLEELEKSVSDEHGISSSSKTDPVQSDEASQGLKKGDRVKFVGPSIVMEDDHRVILGSVQTSTGPANAYTTIHGRPLSTGQLGEVYEVSGDRAAVVFDGHFKIGCEPSSQLGMSSLYWIHVTELERHLDSQSEHCYNVLSVLCEVAQTHEPLIMYFPDSPHWLSRSLWKSNCKEFEKMFDRLSGSVVLICGQNKSISGSKEKENVTMILPNLGRLAKLPFSLKQLTEGLRGPKKPSDNGPCKNFPNVLHLHPPKDDGILRAFHKKIEEDRRIVVSRSNLNSLYRALEVHALSCPDLLLVNTDGVTLTTHKSEKVVGWARSHYLAFSDVPLVKGGRLVLPRSSLEIAILRLKGLEAVSSAPLENLKSIAKDEYESNFISSVVPPGEIGVRFDDIGALEDVKRTLHELVVLPMRRPDLFSHGNLLRPCKGILLFGPPGTGKTLLAKALATEAGANFINITGSTLTSKWFGDAEKLTKALFSFATRLAPVIVFVDEVDSVLGARGGGFEHEATRRMRNEFMAAWDGLRSNDSQRILILGATNRPFDLDDAVIRRLPRRWTGPLSCVCACVCEREISVVLVLRIYVDLPDAGNRFKILKIFLEQENLAPGFDFDQLANATEGYSGSDLKNLCVAAAYRPVQDLLDHERNGERVGEEDVLLRPLALNDFVQAKAKVGPSVAYAATSMSELRKWNEQYGEDGSRRRSPFGFGS